MYCCFSCVKTSRRNTRVVDCLILRDIVCANMTVLTKPVSEMKKKSALSEPLVAAEHPVAVGGGVTESEVVVVSMTETRHRRHSEPPPTTPIPHKTKFFGNLLLLSLYTRINSFSFTYSTSLDFAMTICLLPPPLFNPFS